MNPGLLIPILTYFAQGLPELIKAMQGPPVQDAPHIPPVPTNPLGWPGTVAGPPDADDPPPVEDSSSKTGGSDGIRLLQAFLNAAHPAAQLQEDGVAGAATRAALVSLTLRVMGALSRLGV